ncbi:hypothetical protein NHH03_00005, partial [Stieleria sp. TO1_6]|nr:hypothetical protein [Stieleria tagensis]
MADHWAVMPVAHERRRRVEASATISQRIQSKSPAVRLVVAADAIRWAYAIRKRLHPRQSSVAIRKSFEREADSFRPREKGVAARQTDRMHPIHNSSTTSAESHPRNDTH